MTSYLTLYEVIDLHARIIAASGGTLGILNREALDSAVAQPQMTWGGVDLYPSLVEKAAARAYSLIMNHCFLDGNKRIGHAAMREFLLRNGMRVNADIDEQERIILTLADGKLGRAEFPEWLRGHVEPQAPR